MDRHLRELERRFDNERDERVLQELLQAYARVGGCPPPRVLRLSARWRPVVAFVARWYARPLEDGDGCAAEELEATEARIGGRLPAALREWHRLLGKRLESVQDHPVRLEDLKESGGGAPVWFENQYVWTLSASVDTREEDPPVSVDNEYESPGRLVETLLGMLTGDTLVGAWCERNRGALGPLRDTVRGGHLDGCGPEAVDSLYSLLPVASNPFFCEPECRFRGDETTVLRYNQAGLEWMTATPEAFGRLSPILDLAVGEDSS